MADLEMSVVVANLAAEELEDQRDQLKSHLKQTSLAVIKQAEVGVLAEVVMRNDRVVILGDPGGGKTTLLRYLALKHAEALWSGRAEGRRFCTNEAQIRRFLERWCQAVEDAQTPELSTIQVCR